MASEQTSLLSAVYKWAHRQGENFTTDALVWLVNFLLQESPNVGESFVAWLCFDDELDSSLGRGPLRIATQETVQEGKPDIRIESDALLVLVEVKTGSDLGDAQLRRYRKALERQKGDKTCALVLLSQYSLDLEDGETMPDRHVRWYEVADWLAGRMNEIESEVATFAVQQFLGFLKEQVMTVEHVGWEYGKGVVAMKRLIDMLERALELCSIPLGRKTSGWDWMGLYLDKGKDLWAGIRYSEPNWLFLGYGEGQADFAKFKAIEPPEDNDAVSSRDWRDGCPEFYLRLDDESVHFFALSKESQLARLATFLKQACAEAKACMGDSGETDKK